jgi:hypothetical protein
MFDPHVNNSDEPIANYREQSFTLDSDVSVLLSPHLSAPAPAPVIIVEQAPPPGIVEVPVQPVVDTPIVVEVVRGSVVDVQTVQASAAPAPAEAEETATTAVN